MIAMMMPVSTVPNDCTIGVSCPFLVSCCFDLRGERAHLGVKIAFTLEADTWKVRHGDMAIDHIHAVREAAIGLEQIRIALVAAEPQASRDVERHLMTTVGYAAGG